MPFFSIIIPVYNKSNFIEDCLKSVLSQSFKDFEVIITNDGSTDDSLERIKSFHSEKFQIINQDNLGVSIARNNAAEKASGTYLAFLDADDVWKENHLETLYRSIKLFPDFNFYATNYWIKYSSSFTAAAKINVTIENNVPIVVKDFFEASLSNNIVWTSAACIKLRAFMEYGQFNPKYTTGQDLDLWIRIALKEQLIFHPERTMIYNYSIEDSLGKSEHNEVRLALFSSFKKEEQQNKSLKKYLDIKRYGLALRTKINGEITIFNQALSDISMNNLSYKQRILLKTPIIALRLMNKFRPILLKNPVYLKVFKS